MTQDFCVALHEDGEGWNIILDGEMQYFDLDDDELLRFARDFRETLLADNRDYDSKGDFSSSWLGN